MNPAREALSRAVNRAIANGAPVYIERRPARVIVSIRGVNGEGEASFDYDAWNGMNAVSRVLAIHEQRRDVTGGKPFDVIRERII
jgi:hypothetical protein